LRGKGRIESRPAIQKLRRALLRLAGATLLEYTYSAKLLLVELFIMDLRNLIRLRRVTFKAKSSPQRGVRYGHRPYFEQHLAKVDGWLHEKYFLILDLLDELHEEFGIVGHHLEIGVHHGKFFIPVHNMMRAGEKSIAIDIFEVQSENPDKSGLGDQDILLKHLQELGRKPEDVIVVPTNSLMIEAAQIADLENKYGKFRMFSIDGSHTAQHTFHDFQVAMSLVARGGVIFVDDYYSPHWPGVHEAIGRHFHGGMPKVAPFLFAYNKMLFTSYDLRDAYYEKARLALRELEWFKEVTNFGYPCVTL
jgi:hypothetical protein